MKTTNVSETSNVNANVPEMASETLPLDIVKSVKVIQLRTGVRAGDGYIRPGAAR
jgi:hypothetical protein